MKKIFILLSILFVGKMSSQVFNETFNNGSPTNPTWNLFNNGDFSILSGASYTACTVVGSSANGFLVGEDLSGGPEEAKVNFSTAGFSSMVLKWNGIRQVGAPSLTVSLSTDDVTYTPLVFVDVATDGLWHALTPISIPSGFDNKTTVFLKFSYDLGTASNNIVAFDDIDISGVGSPNFFWDGVGALQNTTSWWTGLNGTGSQATNFTSIGQTFNMGPGGFSSAVLSSNWAVSGTGSKIVLNDGVTPFSLTLSSGVVLSLTGGAQIHVLNTSTLVLQNSTFPGVLTFSLYPGSTIDFAQSAITNLINMSYYNLRISGSADKKQVVSVTVNENLEIVSGRNLEMSASSTRTLTLNGTISGAGALKINTPSNLNINGTGPFGTLNFSAGTNTALTNLNINRASSGTGIVLGTNLSVLSTGIANFTDGLVNLNGKALTLNGATNFGAGTFSGSKTSSINIGATASTSGSLLMNQASATTKALGDLITNTNLTLGTPIEIWGTVTPSVGTITSSGNLTVKQDATNKGRIGTISTGGFSGNVTVENYAPGPFTGWALLGAGGISGKTMNDWYGQFPMAIEGSATGVTSAGGYFESMQGWNEADAYGYDTTITTSTALTPGKGFWSYLGSGLSSTSDFTLSLTGAPVTGNQILFLTKSVQNGENLIANPYASPISYNALVNGNSSVGPMTIWNTDIGSGTGGFAQWNGITGTNGGSDVIPAGQGFYITTSSNAVLVAQESNKLASNTNLMKTTSSTSGIAVKLKLNGFSSDYDETAILFHGSATNGYDLQLDAPKRFNTPGYVGYPGSYGNYSSISTKSGNSYYGINSLPFALTQNAVIPVLVKVMATGQYTITGQDLQLLPPNACATLKDNLLNVTHNLKASPYVFTISDTTSVERFELTICADITTGVNDNNSAVSNLNESVIINNDLNGVYVNLNFDKNTKTKISVTNILGQKIIENKNLTTQNEKVYLGLQPKNQLLFVTVETENNKVTKKIIH